jgi:hypothetical protein
VDNNLITWAVLWFGQHPLGAATMVYAASVFGVLLYSYFEHSYFEPREDLV